MIATDLPSRPRAAVLVVRDDAVLLMHRERDGRTYDVVPGGGIEPGESSEQAAHRELAEETSLQAAGLTLLATVPSESGPCDYYLARGVTGEPAVGGPEAERNSATNRYELRWVPRDQLGELTIQPAAARAVVLLAFEQR